MKSSLPLGVILAAFVAAGVWAGLLAMVHLSGRASLMDRAETIFLDARIALTGRRAAPDAVAIVTVDDAMVADAGRYPLDRRQLAALIDRIRLAGARALAVDMLLVGATDGQADTALATALSRLPAVLAGAGQFSDANSHTLYVPAPTEVLKPLPLLSNAAAAGLANVVADAGGTPRHVPMLFQTAEGPEPSLVLRAAGLYEGQMPSVTAEGLRFRQRAMALDLGWHLPLNYYGGSGTIRTISALDLMNDPDAGQSLKNRLVLLGVTATGVGDRFSTPFDPILPGVEVLATGVSNLIDGSALVRDRTVRRIDAATAMLITLVGVAVVAFLPLAGASMVFASLLVSWFAAITLAFGQFYWLSAALPLAASLPPVAALAVLRQIFDRTEMRQLASSRAALGRFQAGTLSKRIAGDPTFLVEPREQPAAILFIDLVGYTGLSERLGPRRTRDVLKAFHTIVVEETERRHGLVMDFMGDGIMIGFGIPDQTAEDAANAVSTAFGLVRAVGLWLATTAMDPDISTVRVGVHYGPVVLSRLGHENHQQIAATGDCVNVASRLMEVARSRAASVALSSDLVRAAGLEAELLSGGRQFERVEIRGRVQSIEVAVWSASDARSV
ncbi:adenylate/guanylate cyclase domain-containing protein [Rhizobium sp. CG5]|uniref:CHASE2 domain-containing protein n=1 Tax=Rhizobium sp. CG5 TaxID=2726076 RepID=UPI002033FF3D|nr:adenylate/guanylate cyclase domain-containing protein [Rhizobium sp. CG5]MCM2472310.1 adenylate/guanylate cyclase domain-containing protein [Rhizobium sp. CG5]